MIQVPGCDLRGTGQPFEMSREPSQAANKLSTSCTCTKASDDNGSILTKSWFGLMRKRAEAEQHDSRKWEHKTV